ncbi:hypothetical protein [Ottowia sp.]
MIATAPLTHHNNSGCTTFFQPIAERPMSQNAIELPVNSTLLVDQRTC